jgi:RNA polymerase sigma-70 factor (ECF subfamily)
MTENTNDKAPPSAKIAQVVEHLFREEAAKIVASLTRVFGLENLSLAEDVVQEALVRAMQTWPYYGVPENPAAWIMQVARNRAYDVVRRETTFRNKEHLIADVSRIREAVEAPAIYFGQELEDDRLRMLFVCCHPVLAPEAQVMLALKTLCSFSVPEIARAFLTNGEAVAKRLTRAKQKIRDEKVPYEIPAGEELTARLDTVLHTLYLLFNEGYKASNGEKLVRADLCSEAIRLCSLLAQHPSGNAPKTHALLALMLLNGARLAARTDAEGHLLRLRDQDRGCWDWQMIGRGMYYLDRAIAAGEMSNYHLQAGIAAVHCTASDFESTDWSRAVALYDRLLELDDSPIVHLNRAVALAQ